MDKKGLLAYLKKKKFCVLATASRTAKPEAAVVCFVVENDFSVLLYTDPRTRKAKNLRENKQVSLVIGDIDKEIEVQLDGEAVTLEGKVAQDAKESILSIHPDWISHMEKRPVIFIRFKPKWIRYSNFAKRPNHEIVEFEDFA